MTTHLSEAAYAQISGDATAVLKRSKYRAVPVVVTDAGELYDAKAAKANGILGQRFDSKAEAKRYLELRILERAGLIRELVCQPRYDLHAADAARTKVGTYVSDFSYHDVPAGRTVILDVKGHPTPMWKLKRKLVEAEYGVRIEVGA